MRQFVAVMTVVLLIGFAAVPCVCADTIYAQNRELFAVRTRESGSLVRQLNADVLEEKRTGKQFPRMFSSQNPGYHYYQRQLQILVKLMERITRDQRTSDQLLNDIVAVEQRNGGNAAWTLLKRGISGQDRFLKTLDRAHALCLTCRSVRMRLYLLGEPYP